MKRWGRKRGPGAGAALRACILFACGGLSFAAAPTNITELKQAFVHPPDDARIMVRWWWFGPSVTKPELEREMRAMKAGGIRGVGGQPAHARVVGGTVLFPSR